MKYRNKVRYMWVLSVCIIELVTYAVFDAQAHIEVVSVQDYKSSADMLALENIGNEKGRAVFIGGQKDMHTIDQLEERFNEPIFGCTKENTRVIDYFETDSILEHQNGNKFVVKQDTRNLLYLHLNITRDKVGSVIAESIDMPVNKVKIVPAYGEFPGKRAIAFPATVHTFVPGFQISKLPPELQSFRIYIQQPTSRSVAQKKWGLTRRVIANMPLHPDLPKIVALDTFIANADRHYGNFFYCPKSNRYYAIDLERSFNKDLAFYACRLIKSMINDKQEYLSKHEISGLEAYRNALSSLLEKHTPEDVYNKLVEAAVEGRLISRSLRKTVLGTLQQYEPSIKQNYSSCKELVVLLDQLIAQATVKSGSSITEKSELKQTTHNDQDEFLGHQLMREDGVNGLLESTASGQEQEDICVPVLISDVQEQVVSDAPVSIECLQDQVNSDAPVSIEGLQDQAHNEGKLTSDQAFDGTAFGCDSAKIKMIDYFQTPQKTRVAILDCKEDKKFVVKQDTRDALKWHIITVRDKLGSYIAQSAGILANRVEIIPAGFTFPGKVAIDVPATLHNFIPGIPVLKLPDSLKKFKGEIKQWVNNSYPKDQCGLNRSIIHHMAEHEDLSKMVAFDTFIANTDRCTKNYFYDTKSNHFYAIDLESSFNHNVAFYACHCIDSLIKNKTDRFSDKEFQALIVYRKTLKLLIQNNSPEDMYKKMIDFALQGNIISRSLKISVLDRLKKYESSIKENYNSCKKLVVLLDRLIGQLRVNRGVGVTKNVAIEHNADGYQEQFFGDQYISVGDGQFENTANVQEQEYVSDLHEQGEVFASQEQVVTGIRGPIVGLEGMPDDNNAAGKAKAFDASFFGCDASKVSKIVFFQTPKKTQIATLHCKNNKKFIVKQDIRDELTWHIVTVRDKLGSHIAQSAGILANRVEIIPSGFTFPGKASIDLPATLHNFIGGVQVDQLSGSLNKFTGTIKQWVDPSVPKDQCGLNRSIIHHMAEHEDLSKMVAFDTFIANTDRCTKNYFYDTKSNHFYAIDLESSFNHNVAFYACQCIDSLIKNKTDRFSDKELQALIVYRKTLKLLIQNNSPEDMYKKMIDFTLQGNIISRSLKISVLDRLKKYESSIKENYNSCKKLVVLLDRLIGQLRVNRGVGVTKNIAIEHNADGYQEQFFGDQYIGESVDDEQLENTANVQEQEYVSDLHEQGEVFASQEQEVNIDELEQNENLFSSEQVEGNPFDQDIEQFKVIDFFDTGHHTFISVLENKKGKKFILKQETRDQLYWHLTVARDKVGSLIAESINVPVNQVSIIPAFGKFPGKKINELPATFHTFVPGVKVKDLPKELGQFNIFIHQPIKKSVPNKEWGLTRRVVFGMALHPDLPRMAALDTFIGNADRHWGNFFYCPESNRYYAIDLESSFCNNLGFYACNCIKSMINNKHETISKKELYGLMSYRDTLQLLIQIHTPESIYKALRESALEGGLISRSLRKTVLGTLQQYENNIQENYDLSKKLVALLDKLIAKYKHV